MIAMIKGVIFDWDGTIVENTDLWYVSLNKTLEEFGMQAISLDKFTTPIGHMTAQKLSALFGVPEGKRIEMIDSWVNNYEELREHVKVVTGIKDFIAKLKKDGYKIGVVTGGGKERVRREIKEFKMNDFFSAIITRDEAVHDKPDPAGLKLAAGKLNLNPEECVYIGDMDVDIMAAKNCGMFSVAVSWGSHDMDELRMLNPHHVVNDLNELYEAIKKL